MFNREDICLDCKEKETKHPLYEKAREADEAQMRKGNFNFEGIGRPADL
jgi:hypothetical protein